MTKIKCECTNCLNNNNNICDLEEIELKLVYFDTYEDEVESIDCANYLPRLKYKHD